MLHKNAGRHALGLQPKVINKTYYSHIACYFNLFSPNSENFYANETIRDVHAKNEDVFQPSQHQAKHCSAYTIVKHPLGIQVSMASKTLHSMVIQ